MRGRAAIGRRPEVVNGIFLRNLDGFFLRAFLAVQKRLIRRGQAAQVLGGNAGNFPFYWLFYSRRVRVRFVAA